LDKYAEIFKLLASKNQRYTWSKLPNLSVKAISVGRARVVFGKIQREMVSDDASKRGAREVRLRSYHSCHI
jgi:hypothetical protein